MGLTKLQEITHTVESILDHIRDKDFTVNSDLIDIFLESFDICVHLLRNIENSGVEGELDTSDILRRLKNSLENELLGQQMPKGDEMIQELLDHSKKDNKLDNEEVLKDELDSLLLDHAKETSDQVDSSSSILKTNEQTEKVQIDNEFILSKAQQAFWD